jgi:hypothetical protein
MVMVATTSLVCAQPISIGNPSFESFQILGGPKPIYQDINGPVTAYVFEDLTTGNYWAYNYLTAPGGTNAPPAWTIAAAHAQDSLYQGNLNALGDFTGPTPERAPQAFIPQVTGGVGPFIGAIPPGGWELYRADSLGNLIIGPSGEFRQSVANVSPGATTNLNNEDTFFQVNTESPANAGRFFSNGVTAWNSSPPPGMPTPDAAAWLADGNQVLLIRNRSNRVATSGPTLGRGVVLTQTLSTAVAPGAEYELKYLVGDRIGALRLVDYDVRLSTTDGNVILSQDSFANTALRPANDDGKATPNTANVGQFTEITLRGTAPANASGNLIVSFGAGGSFAGPANSGTIGGLVALDKIRLTRLMSQMLGDFNNDGLWNCSDINALSSAIAGGSTNLSFDMNGDGVITLADITAPGNGWLAVGGSNNPAQTGGAPFLNGDANLSGVVNGSDFSFWNDNKFTSTPLWCSGDFNASGEVDGTDFGIWNSNKAAAADGTSVVPEPVLALLCPVWYLALSILRRRKG